MKLQRPDPGIDAAKSGLHGKAGIFFNAGLLEKGEPRFDLQDLDPYLVFDSRESMLGTLENPTLDLDPATPSTLDVITATRASVATYTDPDGLIASAVQDTVRVDYTQGAELTPTKFQNVVQTDYSASPNGGFYMNLTDIDGPEGASGGVRVSETAVTGQHYLSINEIPVVSGQSYTVSFYIKEGAYSSVRVYTQSSKINSDVNFNFSTGTATFGGSDLIANSGIVSTVGGGWYRVSYSAIASSGGLMSLYVTVKNLSSYAGDVNNFTDYYGFQVEEGTTASSFVANTTGSPKFITSATYEDRVPMILCEPSATNQCPSSEGAISDYSVSYEADYLEDDPTPAYGLSHWVDFSRPLSNRAGLKVSSFNPVVGRTYILSFYMRMEDGSPPRVGTTGTGTDTDFLIMIEGNSSSGTSGGIEHIEGDLYRVWGIHTAVSGNNGSIIYKDSQHSDKSFKISGVMLEESSVPTSYIPTSGGNAAARTRAADEISIDGTAFTDFFNAGGDGTFYLELVPTDILKTVRLLTGYGGSSSELILYTNNNSSQVQTWDGTNGANYGAALDSQVNRIGFSYSSTAMKGSINGASEQSGNHDGSFSGKTSIYLGRYTTVPIHYKRLIYWPYHSDSL